MKKTNIIFSFCLFALLSITSVIAQQTQNNNKPSLTPEEKAQRATAHLTKKLGLSQDQSTQVYNITLAHVNKMQGLRANKANGQKQGPAIKQTKNDYDAAINAVLTPAQQQTWAQLKTREQAKRDAKKQQVGNQPNNPNTNVNQPDTESDDYNGGVH
ncbi:MAG: hypothetical protein JWO58_2336 [Chitinophagaceae bacterium]|nr:hypothetical protein [Chitinophagaceae bacterium]